jgi:hypothetical protein
MFVSEQKRAGKSRTTVNSEPLPEYDMMKSTVLSVLFGAAILAGGGAMATPTAEAKATYTQAKDRAEADYKMARAKCDAVTGNPRDVCMAEANAVRVRTREEASAMYKNTLRAFTESRLKIADANFALDKARCAALTGNNKDVCIKQAKATKIAAQADAKADKKAIEARSDARDDKRSAEYKVALEKCDAFAGAAKDSCVLAAKSQYGK